MNLSKISITCATAAILAALLACGGGLPGSGPLQIGGPTPEYSPVPVSTESVGSLSDKLNALGNASGEVQVTITEAELTSVFEQQLAAQPDSPFSNPQVYLRDGKIKLYATVTTSNLTGNALVIMNPVIVDNKLKVTIESADFGPVPAPQSVLDSLASTVNDQLLTLVGQMPTGVGLKSIAIADGNLTLTTVVK
jgi:hypothetical protein